MNLADYLVEAARSNSRSNRELSRWLASFPAGTIDLVVPSSFPSVRETVIHITDVEASWLCDLRGLPEQPVPDAWRDPDPTALLQQVIIQSIDFQSYVEGLPPDSFVETCTYLRYDGVWEQRLRFEIILHTLNHSAFHRGQILAMARLLGISETPIQEPFAL